MATRNFVPGTGPQDWNDPNNWVGTIVPGAGDDALLTSGTVATWAVISGGSTDHVGNITLQNTGLVVGGSADFGGTGSGTLIATGTISDDSNNIASAAGSTITAEGGFFLTTDQAALGGGGTFNGAITNMGVVDADGGNYGLGALVINGPTIAGTGFLRLTESSTLELNAPTSQTLLVDQGPGAVSGTGTLILDQAATFKGAIDVNPGNTLALELPKGQVISGVSLANGALTLTTSAGTESWTLDGSDYSAELVNSGGPGVAAELLLGNSTTLPAARFSDIDTTTGVAITTTGQAYSGPVAGLDWSYADVSADNLYITANAPNAFIHSGAGEDYIDVSKVNGKNVLDGGTGSNFLVGGTGQDNFFVDDRAATAQIWSTVANFHSGDAATVWGVTPQDFTLNWRDNWGAAGYTGLTLLATAPGKPNALLTLAGYSSADLSNGKLSVTFGTIQGNDFMLIQGH